MRKKRTQRTNRLSENLELNKKTITEKLGNSNDVIVREFKINTTPKTSVAIFYTDGLTDAIAVQKLIMESLLFEFNENPKQAESLLEQLKNLTLTVSDLKEVNQFEPLLVSLLSGNVIFLLDGYSTAFEVSLKKWDERGVTESSNETVIRGPKEAFTESIRTNTALIRRKIKDPNLWMESRVIGRVTKTDVALMYIEGIVDQTILKEVKRRLDRIDIDGILESGYIEELIQDGTITPFPLQYS